MIFHMFAIVLKKIKIFWSVIIFNAVYMMNNFFRMKVSSKTFFCNQARTFYIILFITKRMIRRVNVNITLTVISLTTFPHRMFRTLHMRFTFIKRNMSFGKLMTIFMTFFKSSFRDKTSFNSFIPRVFSYTSVCLTGARAIFSSFNSVRMNFKDFFTYNTPNYNFLSPIAFARTILSSMIRTFFDLKGFATTKASFSELHSSYYLSLYQ